MPWGWFSAGLLVTFVLQTAVVGYFQPAARFAPQLDLFMLLAMICGLLAPSADARLAAWITGLAQDLSPAGEALGTHAFALGMLAIALTKLREVANERLWWVRASTAIVAGLGGQSVLLLIQSARMRLVRGPGGAGLAVAGDWPGAVVSAVLTAVLAGALVTLITQAPALLRIARSRAHRPPPRY